MQLVGGRHVRGVTWPLTTVESLVTSETEDGVVGPPPQSIRYSAPTTTGNAVHALMTNVRLANVCSLVNECWCLTVFIRTPQRVCHVRACVNVWLAPDPKVAWLQMG